MGGLQPPEGSAALGEFLFQGFDGFEWAGGDTERGSVDGRQRKSSTQQGFDFLCGQTNRQHSPGGLFLDQTATRRDQCQCVFERKNFRQTGGDVFADAVTDHRPRANAPVHPQPGERVFDDE